MFFFLAGLHEEKFIFLSIFQPIELRIKRSKQPRILRPHFKLFWVVSVGLEFSPSFKEGLSPEVVVFCKSCNYVGRGLAFRGVRVQTTGRGAFEARRSGVDDITFSMCKLGVLVVKLKRDVVKTSTATWTILTIDREVDNEADLVGQAKGPVFVLAKLLPGFRGSSSLNHPHQVKLSILFFL